ncbi:hypothetical protein BaRGS_00027471 [Batillaria attramentaria]|uniref:C2H2-type domain-containing protein n=1 Tax=Batillaria attramentaria TaxID=370345 RepID=A0ABD0K2J3_9CAEN
MCKVKTWVFTRQSAQVPQQLLAKSLSLLGLANLELGNCTGALLVDAPFATHRAATDTSGNARVCGVLSVNCVIMSVTALIITRFTFERCTEFGNDSTILYLFGTTSVSVVQLIFYSPSTICSPQFKMVTPCSTLSWCVSRRTLSTCRLCHLQMHSDLDWALHRNACPGTKVAQRLVGETERSSFYRVQERAHVCPTCGHRFRYTQSLNRHKWKCQGSRMLKCTECDYVTYRMDSLKDHKKSRHNH